MKLLLCLFSVVLFAACDIDNRVDGNSSMRKEQRNITGFSAIEVGASFQVNVQQGSEYTISVEADENLLPYIEIVKEGDRLVIRQKDNFNLKSTKGIVISVQMPEVTGLYVSGSGTIKSAATLKSNNEMELEIGGSGKIQAEIDAPKVHTGIGGSGTATLSGQTRDFDISIGGSGDCFAEALKSENCTISIGGSGTAKVYASQKLDVSIGGSGDVYYAGTPQITKSVAGSGKVRPM